MASLPSFEPRLPGGSPSTLVLNLRQGDRLEVEGRQLVFERDLGHGILQLTCGRTGAPYLVVDPETGEKRSATTAWLDRLRFEGRVRIVRDRRGPRAERRRPPVEFDVDLTDLDKAGRERVRKFRWLKALDASDEAVSLSDHWLHGFITKNRAEPNLTEMGPPPSATTLRRWSNARGLPGDRHLSDMVSRRGRAPRRSGFGPLVAKRMEWAVASYWADLSRDMLECYGEMRRLLRYINSRRAGVREIKVGKNTVRVRRAGRPSHLPSLPIPSFETFRRAVNAAECFDSYAARYRQKAAEARFKANGNGLVATRSLEIAVLDHTTWDAIAVVDGETGDPLGRPTLCLMIDVWSRCVIGWVLSYEPPTLYTALETVKRANRPKLDLAERFPHCPDLALLYGRSGELVVDNALEVAGGSFRDGLLDLGISVRYAPVRSPQYKAIGERIFLTIKKLLATKLPGAVPFSVDRMRELGLDPKATALLTRSEMELLLGLAISEYHYLVHRGIGTRPIQRWLEDMHRNGLDVIEDERDLNRMLGAVRMCRLSRSGVELEGLRFSDPPTVSALLNELACHEPKRDRRKGSAHVRVKVKYNLANLASVEVYHHGRREYVALPCVDQRYAAGLAMSTHRRIRDFAKERNLAFSGDHDRYEARVRLRALIEELSPDLKFRHRRAVARLLEPPLSQTIDGDAVAIARAPARHDGLAPVLVPSGPLAGARSDDGIPAPTRKRGGSSGKSAKRSVVPKALPAPETGSPHAFPLDVVPIDDADAFLDNLSWGRSAAGSTGA